jgi:hypothetical protein
MGAQPSAGQKADGRPSVDGSIDVASTVRDLGTSCRSKNQMETPELASSVTHTPPLLSANASPYDRALCSPTVHPEEVLQFCWPMTPDICVGR